MPGPDNQTPQQCIKALEQLALISLKAQVVDVLKND
ncbi:hypothetical protein COOFOMLJ_02245 [Aeromonas veronii]